MCSLQGGLLDCEATTDGTCRRRMDNSTIFPGEATTGDSRLQMGSTFRRLADLQVLNESQKDCRARLRDYYCQILAWPGPMRSLGICTV